MKTYELQDGFTRRACLCMFGTKERYLIERQGYEFGIIEHPSERIINLWAVKEESGWRIYAPEFGLPITPQGRDAKTRALAVAELMAEKPNGRSLAAAYAEFRDKNAKETSDIYRIYNALTRDWIEGRC